MKLRPNSTQPQIFDGGYEHPWYKYESIWRSTGPKLIKKPNPPSQESIEKAKFVDKTYEWNRTSNIRPRNKRSAK